MFTIWTNNPTQWAQLNDTNLIFNYNSTQNYFLKSRFYLLGTKDSNSIRPLDYFRGHNLIAGSGGGRFLCLPEEEILSKLPSHISEKLIELHKMNIGTKPK